MKILILKPSSLGDVVQALPVLRLIKKHLPHSEIHWWIESKLAPLLAGDPDLAGVVIFDRKRWAQPSNWGEIWSSVRWMREKSFDWVIDLQCLMRSASIAWLANGGLTVGLDEAREGARGFYDLAARRASYHTHAVDWYLAVLPLLGVPVHWDFQWLPERPAGSNVRLKMAGSRRWIIIQPGARWSNKRWPVEYFADLIKRIAAIDRECHFAILGGTGDIQLGQVLSKAHSNQTVDLTGKLSLPEMVEWIRGAELMVTSDTGPMHVAAALRKPVVALFGPTEPRRTGPYGQINYALQLALPCVPCMKSRCAYSLPFECLRALSPTMVFEAVQKRLRL